MFLEERYSEILKELSLAGRVSVKGLASEFSVTEDCIRKYLKELENMGKLKRVYGGAIPITPYTHSHIGSVWERKTINLDVKTIIAQKALALIEPYDHLFLDSSTTNLELAKLLATNDLPLTVITNMPEILLVLAPHPHIDLIVIGGLFSKSAGGTMGSEANYNIQKYRYDKAFLGVCGVNVEGNYLCSFDQEDGYTKKTIMDQATQIYLVMENEKFAYDELYKYSTLDAVTGIISECTPSPKLVSLLSQKSIALI